jgi:hypothetical protein
MVYLTAIEHAVRRSKCEQALDAIAIWCATSLAILGESLVEGSLVSFLRGCLKVLLPIFWWPAAIRINFVHQLGVASLTIILERVAWRFV